MPAQGIHRIITTPTEQRRAPRDRAVQDRLLRPIPEGIDRDVESTNRRVDVRVGRAHQHLLPQRAKVRHSVCVHAGQIHWFGRGGSHTADSLQREIARLARLELHPCDRDGLGGRGRWLGEQSTEVVPVSCVAQRGPGALWQDAGDVCDGTL